MLQHMHSMGWHTNFEGIFQSNPVYFLLLCKLNDKTIPAPYNDNKQMCVVLFALYIKFQDKTKKQCAEIPILVPLSRNHFAKHWYNSWLIRFLPSLSSSPASALMVTKHCKIPFFKVSKQSSKTSRYPSNSLCQQNKWNSDDVLLAYAFALSNEPSVLRWDWRNCM